MKKKNKIIFLKWLPASGKSSFAKEYVSNPKNNCNRVNKDDIRAMLNIWVWSKANEHQVLAIRDYIIIESLKNKKDIIVDDTNFALVHLERMKELAKEYWAIVEEKYFDTDVYTCIERDSLRPNKVWKEVILDMYNKYIKKEKVYNEEWTVVIFDIDWTLARMDWRSPYEWEKVDTDKPVKQVVDVLNSLSRQYYDIYIVSWRDEICREKTENWLKENSIDYCTLFMRKEGDKRDDTIVKKEILGFIWKENVFAVFDDRPKVVRFWRAEWLFVFDVWDWLDF